MTATTTHCSVLTPWLPCTISGGSGNHHGARADVGILLPQVQICVVGEGMVCSIEDKLLKTPLGGTALL